jgi:membrane associated rhomboid family serine protease
VLWILGLLALGAAAIYRATTLEERQRFLEEKVQPAAVAIDNVFFATAPFRERLIKRTPWLVATPVIAGLHLLFFACFFLAGDAASENAALVVWGASYGPSTTNGEWWRLVTAVLLQPGPFHLLFILIGSVQLCELLERFVGPYMVAAVYLVAGVSGTLLRLTHQPLAVHAGASAAVCGLYGLLFAVVAWTWVRLRAERIPLAVFKTLAPGAVVFFGYTLLSFEVSGAANWRGFFIGLVTGIALTVDAGDQRPSWKPLGVWFAASVALIVYLAAPLRGIVDIRPELVGIVAKEERTADMYRSAVGRYTRHQRPVDTAVLIALIDDTILPQLNTSRTQVAALTTPLPEHQPLLEGASEYLRLRESSWRLRAEALRKRNMTTLKNAEEAEQESLRALQRLRQMRTAM